MYLCISVGALRNALWGRPQVRINLQPYIHGGHRRYTHPSCLSGTGAANTTRAESVHLPLRQSPSRRGEAASLDTYPAAAELPGQLHSRRTGWQPWSPRRRNRGERGRRWYVAPTRRRMEASQSAGSCQPVCLPACLPVRTKRRGRRDGSAPYTRLVVELIMLVPHRSIHHTIRADIVTSMRARARLPTLGICSPSPWVFPLPVLEVECGSG